MAEGEFGIPGAAVAGAALEGLGFAARTGVQAARGMLGPAARTGARVFRNMGPDFQRSVQRSFRGMDSPGLLGSRSAVNAGGPRPAPKPAWGEPPPLTVRPPGPANPWHNVPAAGPARPPARAPQAADRLLPPGRPGGPLQGSPGGPLQSQRPYSPTPRPNTPLGQWGQITRSGGGSSGPQVINANVVGSETLPSIGSQLRGIAGTAAAVFGGGVGVGLAGKAAYDAMRNQQRRQPQPQGQPMPGPVTDPRNQGQLDALRREMSRRNAAPAPAAAGGGGGGGGGASAVTPPPPPVLPPPTSGRPAPAAAASPAAAGAGAGITGPTPAPAAAASGATALPQSPGTSAAGAPPAPQFRFDSSAPDAGDVGRPGFYKPPAAGTPEAASHQSDMALIRSAYTGSLHLDDNFQRSQTLRSPQAAGEAGSTALISGGADPKIPLALEPNSAPGPHGAMGPTGSPGFDRVSNQRDAGGFTAIDRFDSSAKQQMLGDAARNMGDLKGTDLGNQLSSYLNEAAAAAAPDAGDVGVPVGHKASDGSSWNGSSWERYVSPQDIGDAMGSDRFISGLKGINSPTALTTLPSVYSEARQGPAGFSVDHALAAAANVPDIDMSKVLGPDYFRNAQLFGDRDGGLSGIVRKMPLVKVDPNLTSRIRLANVPPI